MEKDTTFHDTGTQEFPGNISYFILLYLTIVPLGHTYCIL